MTIDEIEVIEARFGYLESEITSYIDQLAESIQDRNKFKLERNALRAELTRIRTTGEII